MALPQLLAVLPAVNSARCAMGGVGGSSSISAQPPPLSEPVIHSTSSPGLSCLVFLVLFDTGEHKLGGGGKGRREVEELPPQPLRMWAGESQGGFRLPLLFPRQEVQRGSAVQGPGSQEDPDQPSVQEPSVAALDPTHPNAAP